MHWATKLTLIIGGAPAAARAVVAWVAVLPVPVVLSNWMDVPAVLAWASAGVAVVVGLFLMRGGDAPFAPDQKRLAARAILTGVGTGDPDLDGYALGKLDRRKRAGQLTEKITLSVIMLVLVASPILASTSSSAWWLLMLPVEAAVLASAIPYLTLDIDENIERLEADIPPGLDPS